APYQPQLNTPGVLLVSWGFFFSTVMVIHGTVSIISLGHTGGSKRSIALDASLNNPFLALLTLGEGWQNDHHRWAVSCREGFYWWELDITWLILKLMSWVGIVRELNPVPAHVLAEGRSQQQGSHQHDQQR